LRVFGCDHRSHAGKSRRIFESVALFDPFVGREFIVNVHEEIRMIVGLAMHDSIFTQLGAIPVDCIIAQVKQAF